MPHRRQKKSGSFSYYSTTHNNKNHTTISLCRHSKQNSRRKCENMHNRCVMLALFVFLSNTFWAKQELRMKCLFNRTGTNTFKHIAKCGKCYLLRFEM